MMIVWIYYSASVAVRSILVSLSVCVCVSVCPWAYLWNRSTDPHEILSTDPCGSVFLWWHCATLCTSGFMDDVMFSRSGCDAETLRLHHAATTVSGVAIPDGAWCLWMLVWSVIGCAATLDKMRSKGQRSNLLPDHIWWKKTEAYHHWLLVKFLLTKSDTSQSYRSCEG